MSDSLVKSVEVVAAPWKDSPYYDDAEQYIGAFWHEPTVFRRLFGRLDLGTVIELACGHGRHSERIAEQCGRLILMDVVKDNVEFCRNRLSRFRNVEFHVNNGYDFTPVEDGFASAIFCYDAMVHFSSDIVESYLKDTARVLKQGGMALYHHSNYTGPVMQHYGMHPHARNYLSNALFREFCVAAGLEVVESIKIPWGESKDLDCVSLVRKP